MMTQGLLDEVRLHLKNVASHERDTPTQSIEAKGKIIRRVSIIECLQSYHSMVQQKISTLVIISAAIVWS